MMAYLWAVILVFLGTGVKGKEEQRAPKIGTILNTYFVGQIFLFYIYSRAHNIYMQKMNLLIYILFDYCPSIFSPYATITT